MDAGGLGRGRIAGRVTGATRDRVTGSNGNIDRDKVAAVINSHLAEVRRCYERELLKRSDIQGKATLEWVITVGGDVRRARTKTSTLNGPGVEACLLDHLKKWKFPRATQGDVTISYPFVFNSVAF